MRANPGTALTALRSGGHAETAEGCQCMDQHCAVRRLLSDSHCLFQRLRATSLRGIQKPFKYPASHGNGRQGAHSIGICSIPEGCVAGSQAEESCQ